MNNYLIRIVRKKSHSYWLSRRIKKGTPLPCLKFRQLQIVQITMLKKESMHFKKDKSKIFREMTGHKKWSTICIKNLTQLWGLGICTKPGLLLLCLHTKHHSLK